MVDPLLRRALKLMNLRATQLPTPPRRAENADRNLWRALDFHTRTGRHRAKNVAKDWQLAPEAARLVSTIASRLGRKPEFQQVLRACDHTALRKLVRIHRDRITHVDGWRRHIEALNRLQVLRLI